MPELNFRIESAEPEPVAAIPTLTFKLGIEAAGSPHPIHTVILRCQIQIEPGRRRYNDAQREGLFDLFGPPSLWSQSLRPMLWTQVTATAPAFTGSTQIGLQVPCSYDFSLAATKYFDALQGEGDIPLCFLFSGTVFYQDTGQGLQAAPISWNKEANFRLSVDLWRRMMDQYYPNQAWLALRKEVFDRFRQFKTQAGHVTWEQALEALLEGAGACQKEVP